MLRRRRRRASTCDSAGRVAVDRAEAADYLCRTMPEHGEWFAAVRGDAVLEALTSGVPADEVAAALDCDVRSVLAMTRHARVRPAPRG